MMAITRGLCQALVLATASVCLSTPASAAFIEQGSVLNFGGQSTCNATTCTFGNVFVASGTGSFSNFTFGTEATFFTLVFSPFQPQQIYSTTNAIGQTASFFATAEASRSTETQAGLMSLTIRDLGTARLTGFDDTPGWILFTANQDGVVQGSFSATSNITAVPEPGTWAMLLVGFGAVGYAIRRRRFKIVGDAIQAPAPA